MWPGSGSLLWAVVHPRATGRAPNLKFKVEKVYEDTRKALGGVHLVENGLWRARHFKFDYLMQVCSWFAPGLFWVCTFSAQLIATRTRR